MRDQVIEVEVDAKRNRNLYFAPIDRIVRGRFDWKRVADKNGAELREAWGEEPLPGQRISIDASSQEGAVSEPLHDRPELKKRVESRDQMLPPARQTFANVNANEWLYWLRAAVTSGDARLLQGEIPATVDFTPKRFAESRSSSERLTEALVAVLYAGLSDKQRKEVAQLTGG